VKCAAVTHRENWMCVVVCGYGTDSTCDRAVLVQGDRQLQRSTPVRRYDYLRCHHAVGLPGQGGGGLVGGPANFLFNGYWVPTSE
jgi:hypothetical protein